MKLASWNINSLRAREDMVLDWLEQNRPDVLCLQETKITDQEFPEDAFGDLNYDVTFFGQRTYNGVAIISRPEMRDIVKGFPEDKPDDDKRLVAATIEGIRVVCVYVPNGQSVGSDRYDFKLGWYARLKSWLEETASPSSPVVVCGDFNVAPADEDVHDPIAWRGQILFSEPERAALRDLCAWGLTDAYRHRHPESRRFTWWDYRAGSWERNHGLRIDHFLITKPILDRMEDISIDEPTRALERASDHVPVVLQLRDTGGEE